MPDNTKLSDRFIRLRQQAEKLIQQRPAGDRISPTDVPDLINELSVHQAELEIQNEELRRSQQELSLLHQEYERLYEFAPCGYVALNSKGIITRANLKAVALLGATRKLLNHQVFSQFIDPDHQDVFLSARKEAGKTGEKQSIELLLKREKKSPLWVRAEIEADRDAAGRQCIVLGCKPQRYL